MHRTAKRSQALPRKNCTSMTKPFGISFFEISAHGVHIGLSLDRCHSRLQMSHDLEHRVLVPARVQLAIPIYHGLIDDRDKKIGRAERQRAAKPGRRYTDHGKRMLV